ncbi:MBL fold metallo-hydrolase [Nakamurella leprariae]|uniref:MBL fold metallo-hydrolase n=1 Tax=Nakamurella leprariae TaxID=2803911 RepID=A0A938YEC6_9ACTN|nr:MBL fold metallo-hydrolase [Nakamurella leprariae]MBM9466634.1 MBL fold metallo-hydrolase [Nakamurella leprariae]
MQLTKFGHSCLRVRSGAADLLIDPGTFSAGFESLTGLTAVLITHQHPDHLDVARVLALLRANPQAQVIADHETAQFLDGAGVQAREVGPGTVLDLGVPVEVVGERHAVIHADLEPQANVGYLVDDRLLHPGDALTVLRDRAVEILALPVSAPWMALKEAIDYFRAVAPQVVVPIHEKVLANPSMPYQLLQRLGPPARWLDLDAGEPTDV